MIAETRAIVLRQVRTVNSRRVITLFTEDFGKLSAGVTVSERGRNKASLAMQPFTLGRYELFKNKDYYHMNRGQVLKSFYDLGQDVDKYMAAGAGLELLDKVLEEWLPEPELFRLTVDYLTMMEGRERDQRTLLLAFKVKMLDLLGFLPHEREELASLLSDAGFAIIDVLKFMLDQPMSKLEKLALKEGPEQSANAVIDRFFAEHLDVRELKSSQIYLLDPKE